MIWVLIGNHVAAGDGGREGGREGGGGVVVEWAEWAWSGWGGRGGGGVGVRGAGAGWISIFKVNLGWQK